MQVRFPISNPMSNPSKYPQSPCYQCPVSWNAINGRWCPKLRCYVEYATRIPCRRPGSPTD